MCITKFNCSCGNNNPKKAQAYDGALGYEAIICKVCGSYYDYMGKHEADEFSNKFVVKRFGISV